YVTHLTQSGVWGDKVSPNILFSPPGAGYACAWWRKERFLAGLQPAKPPVEALLRKVSMACFTSFSMRWHVKDTHMPATIQQGCRCPTSYRQSPVVGGRSSAKA